MAEVPLPDSGPEMEVSDEDTLLMISSATATGNLMSAQDIATAIQGPPQRNQKRKADTELFSIIQYRYHDGETFPLNIGGLSERGEYRLSFPHLDLKLCKTNQDIFAMANAIITSTVPLGPTEYATFILYVLESNLFSHEIKMGEVIITAKQNEKFIFVKDYFLNISYVESEINFATSESTSIEMVHYALLAALFPYRMVGYIAEAKEPMANFVTKCKAMGLETWNGASGYNDQKFIASENAFNSFKDHRSYEIMVAIFDICALQNKEDPISKFRLASIRSYCKDSALLVRMHDLFSLGTSITDTVAGLCVESTLASQFVDAMSPGIDLVDKESILPYNRSLRLVEKSRYALNSFPALMTYLSTFLAVHSNPSLYHTKYSNIEPARYIKMGVWAAEMTASVSKLGVFIRTIFEDGKIDNYEGSIDLEKLENLRVDMISRVKDDDRLNQQAIDAVNLFYEKEEVREGTIGEYIYVRWGLGKGEIKRRAAPNVFQLLPTVVSRPPEAQPTQKAPEPTTRTTPPPEVPPATEVELEHNLPVFVSRLRAAKS